jgi:hypothetical protein
MNGAEVADPVVLAIVGWRGMRNAKRFDVELDRWIAKHGVPDRIVTGCARGADQLARDYADRNGIAKTVKRAQWTTHGRAAGPIRNTQIVGECTHMLAFVHPSSTGTLDSIAKARSAGRPVTQVNLAA